MVKRVFIISILLLTLAPVLISCGVKPGSVDPPPGAEDIEFPRTYPDPSTDSAP